MPNEIDFQGLIDERSEKIMKLRADAAEANRLMSPLKAEVRSLRETAAMLGIEVNVPAYAKSYAETTDGRRRALPSDTATGKAILALVGSEGPINYGSIMRALEAHFSHGAVSATVTMLLREGVLERPSRGIYQVPA